MQRAFILLALLLWKELLQLPYYLGRFMILLGEVDRKFAATVLHTRTLRV